MSRRSERVLLAKLGGAWATATPGLRVQAYHRGRKIIDVEVGKTDPFYDWASLTKVVFTTTALMRLHDEGVFRVNDRVSRWVPWFPESSRARLRDLLSHSAGLTWWHPFYKSMDKWLNKSISMSHSINKQLSMRKKSSTESGPRVLKTPEEAWDVFQSLLKRKVLADLKGSESGSFSNSSPSVYSDLDFLLLGVVLESMAGAGLYAVWSELRDRLGFADTDFHRGNRPRHARQLYAPTEACSWRGKILQGEVHDENAWALGGVAPHAGLFGPIDDLSRWGLLLRAAIRGADSRHFPGAETVRLFTKRSIPRARGDWALGFMLPTKGAASCGPLFSTRSVGHTGFTGTSIWYDPDRDLLVSLLSNRVHPTRENREFVALRPRIHTWIAEGLS